MDQVNCPVCTFLNSNTNTNCDCCDSILIEGTENENPLEMSNVDNNTEFVLVSSGSIALSGSIELQGGSYNVDGVSVLDSAIAFAIALG